MAKKADNLDKLSDKSEAIKGKIKKVKNVEKKPVWKVSGNYKRLIRPDDD